MIARFEDHTSRIIAVLKECFPRDSTVQDLSAAVGWSLHNPTMINDGDGVIPWYEGTPRFISQAPCGYPNSEHPSRGGNVLIEALIGRSGNVRFARVKQSVPMFDESALDCVRRRHYRPAEFEGRPFGFRLMIYVDSKSD
jgi:TonB family protein